MLEAIVPYAEPALARFLGGRPDQFCSPATARAMAMAAYRRAVEMADAPGDGPGRGLHRRAGHRPAEARSASIARRGSNAARRRGWSRSNWKRDVAPAKKKKISWPTSCSIWWPSVVDFRIRAPLALPTASGLQQAHDRGAELRGRRCWPARSIRCASVPPSQPTAPPEILFPGAFHPLHDGHRGMAAVAAAVARGAGRIRNRDRQCRQAGARLSGDRAVACGSSRADQPLWLTRAPTFVEKSLLFPGVTFIVGADTMERIAAARFYDDDPRRLDRAIETLARQGCRFLVFGRAAGERFSHARRSGIAAGLGAACAAKFRRREFRIDLSSSSELRRQAELAEPDRAVTRSAGLPAFSSDACSGGRKLQLLRAKPRLYTSAFQQSDRRACRTPVATRAFPPMSEARSFIGAGDAQGPFFVGVDVGGTSFKLGVVDDLGRVLARRCRSPTTLPRDRRPACERMAGGVRQAIADAKLDAVADRRGRAWEPPERSTRRPGFCWARSTCRAGRIFAIRDRLGHGLPICRCCTPTTPRRPDMANFGSAADANCSSMVLFTLGTGVGGAIILGDEPLDGDHGNAGELGHVTIDYNEVSTALRLRPTRPFGSLRRGLGHCRPGSRGCWPAARSSSVPSSGSLKANR